MNTLLRRNKNVCPWLAILCSFVILFSFHSLSYAMYNEPSDDDDDFEDAIETMSSADPAAITKLGHQFNRWSDSEKLLLSHDTLLHIFPLLKANLVSFKADGDHGVSLRKGLSQLQQSACEDFEKLAPMLLKSRVTVVELANTVFWRESLPDVRVGCMLYLLICYHDAYRHVDLETLIGANKIAATELLNTHAWLCSGLGDNVIMAVQPLLEQAKLSGSYDPDSEGVASLVLPIEKHHVLCKSDAPVFIFHAHTQLLKQLHSLLERGFKGLAQHPFSRDENLSAFKTELTVLITSQDKRTPLPYDVTEMVTSSASPCGRALSDFDLASVAFELYSTMSELNVVTASKKGQKPSKQDLRQMRQAMSFLLVLRTLNNIAMNSSKYPVAVTNWAASAVAAFSSRCDCQLVDAEPLYRVSGCIIVNRPGPQYSMQSSAPPKKVASRVAFSTLSMSEQHESALKRALPKMEVKVNVDNMLALLHRDAGGFLNDYEEADVKSQRNRMDKVRVLFQALRSKSDSEFKNFCRILRETNQAVWADHLMNSVPAH
ncbi:hypothetical protein [Spongorhabdus nitratireducens]